MTATLSLASPCTGICRLDAVHGWCLGCGRDGQEIAEWRHGAAAWRDAIWDDIPLRLSQMGVACRRLPWTGADLRDFVLSSLAPGRGTWVMGIVGAVGEFRAAPGADVSVAEDGDDIVAHTPGGAIRMAINDHVRALTFDPPGADQAPRIVLAVKRERGRLPMATGVTALGPDDAALIPSDAQALYDLGLARREGRFCVRVGLGASQSALDRADGLSFGRALPQIAPALLSESPIRVVESALGRIEVAGDIPPPDASSPPGPHTHLLPDYIATGRALPTGMDLPRAYLPGAIYYPPSA